MKQQRKSRLSIVIALCLAACAPIASIAQTIVGSQTLELRDASRQRAVVSEIWFKADSGSEVKSLPTAPPFIPLEFALGANAPADVKARPLVVISHGNWGSRYSQGGMAIELVKAGYTVLTVSHPASMNNDTRPEGRVRQWERALDVSYALTQVLADSRWKTLIDPARIGFAGHSFGGTTGVLLAGGNWSWTRQREACLAATAKDQFCRDASANDYSAVSLDGMNASYRDARIKSFYIMASGPAAGFSAESLQSIKSPFLVDTAKLDDVLEPGMNSSRLAKAIPTAQEVVRDVGHFVYIPICKPVIGKTLAAQFCTDPDGIDRVQIHKSVNTKALEFFAQTL
jgi:predicted dienelactone hydrolase